MAARPEPLRLFEPWEDHGTGSPVTNEAVGGGLAALQAIELSAKKVRQANHCLEQAIRVRPNGWRRLACDREGGRAAVPNPSQGVAAEARLPAEHEC